MTKNRRTRIVYLITLHTIVIVSLIKGVSLFQQDQLQHYISETSTGLKSVTSTLAANGASTEVKAIAAMLGDNVSTEALSPTYVEARQQFKRILDTNGLKDCELSFIVKAKPGGAYQRAISSDPLYSSGERLIDRNGFLSDHGRSTRSELINVNEDIVKLAAFSPWISDKGEIIGHFRIETGDLSQSLDTYKGYWLTAALVLFYIVVINLIRYWHTVKLNSQDFNSEEISIKETLRQKNDELKLLSLVAKKSNNLMLITDEKGCILWINDTYERKNRFTAEELNEFTGKQLHELSQNENIRTIIKNVVDFSESITYESQGMDSSGQMTYAVTTVTPITDESGRVTNLLFVDSDITSMKEADLRHQVFESMANRAQLPMMIASASGQVTYANSAAEPALALWTEANKKLKPRIVDQLRSILDSGEAYMMNCPTNQEEIILGMYPRPELDLVMIVGQDQANSGLSAPLTPEILSSYKQAG